MCHGADIKLDISQSSPLHLACLGGHIDVARVLLEWGADLNTPNVFGMTPLGYAASKNHKHVVEFLLSKGAKINKVSNILLIVFILIV